MREQIPDWYKAVGDGWTPILAELHLKLLAKEPEYRVAQVKEKFGALRVYLTQYRPDLEDLIEEAGEKSEKICERCGGPGSLRQLIWIKTLCQDCLDIRQAERTRIGLK